MGSSAERAGRVWTSENKLGPCVNCAGLSDGLSSWLPAETPEDEEAQEEGWVSVTSVGSEERCSELRSPLRSDVSFDI